MTQQRLKHVRFVTTSAVANNNFYQKATRVFLGILAILFISSCQHLVGERGLIYDHYNDYKQNQEEPELLSPPEIKAITQEEFYPIASQSTPTNAPAPQLSLTNITAQEIPPDSTLALSYRYVEFAGKVVPLSNANINKEQLYAIAKAANPSVEPATPSQNTIPRTASKESTFNRLKTYLGLGGRPVEGGYRAEVNLNRIGTNSGYVKKNQKQANEQRVLLIQHSRAPQMIEAMHYALRAHGFRIIGNNAEETTIYFVTTDNKIMPETPVYQLHIWYDVAQANAHVPTRYIVFVTDNHGQFLHVERTKRILNQINAALLGQREFSYLQWLKEVVLHGDQN